MSDFQKQFKEIIRGDARIMDMLRAVRSVGIPDWYIAAGAVRNLVWDKLHGLDRTPPKDIDVVFFDSDDLSEEYEEVIRSKLREQLPDVPWTVVNQARVHLWIERRFGRKLMRPYASVEEGIGSWAETASCVGARLEADDSLTVFAPFLDDLFGLILRNNPERPDKKTFERRVKEKKWRDRWPKIKILE